MTTRDDNKDNAPSGQSGSTDVLFSKIYRELHGLARQRMTHERVDLTLQPTALVHEVYIRLMKDPTATWENSRHFFGAAAEAMRRILIERARGHAALKRGGKRRRVSLESAEPEMSVDGKIDPDDESAATLLVLDVALAELRAKDERLAEVVMLRYFAGLSVEETSAAQGRSPRTVKRDWAFARTWLARRLKSDMF